MNNDHDILDKFQDDYLDYLEGARDEPPSLEDMPVESRRMAEAFIESITAARGVDPYASRPSIEQLLAYGAPTSESTSELRELLQDHLQLRVDPLALVTPDVASSAIGLASVFVIQARGLRLRVVPEAASANLAMALPSRAGAIARVFSAFPETHAVLYTTTGHDALAVMVDRGDVHGAIETPSGERRSPRLRRPIDNAGTACEIWLKGLIPEFEPLGTDLLRSTDVPESALNLYQLASEVVSEVSAAGNRARIEAKRDTWQAFGDQEAQFLTVIAQEAQHGRLPEDGYRSLLDELVGEAA